MTYSFPFKYLNFNYNQAQSIKCTMPMPLTIFMWKRRYIDKVKFFWVSIFFHSSAFLHENLLSSNLKTTHTRKLGEKKTYRKDFKTIWLYLKIRILWQKGFQRILLSFSHVGRFCWAFCTVIFAGIFAIQCNTKHVFYLLTSYTTLSCARKSEVLLLFFSMYIL